MDWTTILKAQQTDFIQRLKSGDLLHCEKEGQHSELTVISGERLQQLRDFCWDMAEKYRHTSSTPIRNVFINNLKGKLGEEVVKSRLGNFVTEVDYEKRIGGDGKIDFTLTSDSSIGIQVKTRYGNFDKVQWSIDREEIEKNAVLICILCQEEFSENEKEYGLIIAGFLPTNMIKSADTKASLGIDELFYLGGLRGYLENFKSSTSYDSDKYIILGDECVNNKNYQGAIFDYYHALYLISNEASNYYVSDATMAIIYYKIGNARYTLGDYKGAIDDYTQAINLNPASDNAYNKRGNAYYILEQYYDAINDYTKAINLNPASDNAYNNRGNAYYQLERYYDAIDDYTQSINLNPASDSVYDNRGNAYYKLERYYDAIDDYTFILGNKQVAIDDLNKAASIYKQGNNFHDYHKTFEQLQKIQYDDVKLISASGMDYRKLRDLLKTGKWTEADEETRRVMLAVAKQDGESWLDHDSIDKFPYEDLCTIDYLWVKYSNGKFGFSVQKIIYQGLAKTYDSKMWNQFIHKIGRYIYEINASNDINAPTGYFPGNAGGIWLDYWGEDVDYEFVKGWFDDYLFRRVDICKMYNIKSEKIYEPLTKHNTQVSDDYEDNYPAADLNNNDDYFDDYISDYDDYFDDYNDYDYDIKQFSQNTKQYLL
jgi:tetratricopeptide (TPR) repeat protein